MISSLEHPVSTAVQPVNFCFLNPAWVPEWFWLPTAHVVAESGAGYDIPPLERERAAGGIESNIDIIESTMGDMPSQYIVALSRGVEYAVRYLDRMAKTDRLQHVIGWTVISSAGPRGYETKLENFNGVPSRHTESYKSGISLDESGLEVIDPNVVRTCMLHDVDDTRLSDEIIKNLTKAQPLTEAEIECVPFLDPNSLPLAWYIGRNDKVDNSAVSAAIARQIFQIEPTFTDWGHISPLTHTDQVVEALLSDVHGAQLQRGIHHG